MQNNSSIKDKNLNGRENGGMRQANDMQSRKSAFAARLFPIIGYEVRG